MGPQAVRAGMEGGSWHAGSRDVPPKYSPTDQDFQETEVLNLRACSILFPASLAVLATSSPSQLARRLLFSGVCHQDQEEGAGLTQPADKPGRRRP